MLIESKIMKAREGNIMGSTENDHKILYKCIKKYQELGIWTYNEKSSDLENLENFEKVLVESFRILVLLRHKGNNVVSKEQKSESSDEIQKGEKPFAKFDRDVFAGQLASWKVSDLTQQNFNFNENKLESCKFKSFFEDLNKLIEEFKGNSVSNTLIFLSKFKNEACIILIHLNKYKSSKHFMILKRVRLRKKFFDIFSESIENFKKYIEKVLKKYLSQEEIESKDRLHKNKLKTESKAEATIERNTERVVEPEIKTTAEQNTESVVDPKDVDNCDLEDLMFFENVYNKGNENLDMEKQVEYAKEVIKHGLICFIGACKYVTLENSAVTFFLGSTGIKFNRLDWDKQFIVSLKNTQRWKEVTPETLNGIFPSDVYSQISEAKTWNDLIEAFKRIPSYGFSIKRNDQTDSIPNKINIDVNSLYNALEEWRKKSLRCLEKINNQSEAIKDISKFEEINNKKRAKVTEDKRKNEVIDKKLKEKWIENKKGLKDPDNRKTLSETVEAANEAYEKLKERGILFDNDTSKGNDPMAAGYSKNFVKLFIRYLERSFPELDDCVEIYYYGNPIRGSGGRYWNQIRQYKAKSKNNGKVYFIVNEFLGGRILDAPNGATDEQKRLLKGGNAGHGNLTVICNGKYKVFETVNGVEYMAIEDKEFGKYPKLSGATIQVDDHNCLAIGLGYMESLMKQMSKNKKALDENNKKEIEEIEKLEKKKESLKGDKKEVEKVEEELKNRKEELNKKNSKELSNNMFKEINRFSTVQLPENIKGLDKNIGTGEKLPMKILLPTKYIKYLQSRSSIEDLINYIDKLDSSNKDYYILQEVKTELERVIKKYTFSNETVDEFLTELGDMNFENQVRFYMNHLKLKSNTSTVKDLIDAIEKRGLTKEKGIEIFGKDVAEKIWNKGYKDNDYSNNKLIDLVEVDNKKSELENELKKNQDIYRLFFGFPYMFDPYEKDSTEMKVWQLIDLEEFLGKLKSLLRRNLRAQTKRRTETLKIATLVEALDDAKASVADEIDAVRDFTDTSMEIDGKESS